MMSCKVQKWNKYNWQQERSFVITNLMIYNFNKKSKDHYSFILIFYHEFRTPKINSDLIHSWFDQANAEGKHRVCYSHQG